MEGRGACACLSDFHISELYNFSLLDISLHSMSSVLTMVRDHLESEL